MRLCLNVLFNVKLNLSVSKQWSAPSLLKCGAELFVRDAISGLPRHVSVLPTQCHCAQWREYRKNSGKNLGWLPGSTSGSTLLSMVGIPASYSGVPNVQVQHHRVVISSKKAPACHIDFFFWGRGIKQVTKLCEWMFKVNICCSYALIEYDGGIAPRILNFNIIWRWLATFTPLPRSVRGQRLLGTNSRSGYSSGEDENACAPSHVFNLGPSCTLVTWLGYPWCRINISTGMLVLEA